jgi:MEDS: MEthanogen/methylotroph, DcmR Sensory domain
MTAPAPRWSDEFVHPALFYRGTAEYLEGTVPFIREGLAAGEPVALAVPGPNLRLILAELGSDAERVRLLDMTRSGRNPGRIVPNVLRAFADAHRFQRVRIIGEHLWTGHSAREYPACAQHEALIHIALTGRSVTMLCPYDANRVGMQTLADAEATHPLLIGANGKRASTAYAPAHVAADALFRSPTLGPSFTFDATNQALAGQFASDHATRYGLGSDHAELKLLINELTTKALMHGSGTGTLRIWAEQGYLVCEVRHAGQPDNPTIDRRPADPRQSDGRGLLAHYLSDLVQQRSCLQGTATWVYLRLASADAPANDAAEPALAAPRNRPAPSGPTPLPWQTYEALHAAERFGRYVPQDATIDIERPVAASVERAIPRRPVEPVLEALTAVEALARVVDRWRARLVRLARIRGAPWTDIGQSLGVSKQAAHERYGRLRPRSAAHLHRPTQP